MRWVALAACLSLAGCSRYADFTLPVLAGTEGAVQYRWNVHPVPVLERGAPGEWDAVDALNPSVLLANGLLFNLYSGYDGTTWHTGLATSNDGISWTKHGRILSPDPRSWEGGYIAANGAALYDKGRYLYWYQAGRLPRIGLAASNDGKQWTRKGEKPVLDAGPRGSWDERGAADPYVVRFGEWLYMYYLGQDRARRQRLGVARSRDGSTWEKHRANPLLELGAPGKFDETGLGEPAVWSDRGWYWMLYTARNPNEERSLGLARSRDGIAWSRVSDQPVLSGSEGWNAKVICDPHVQPNTDPLWVWFGGGDKAQPAEHLNGQIGHATLKLALTP